MRMSESRIATYGFVDLKSGERLHFWGNGSFGVVRGHNMRNITENEARLMLERDGRYYPRIARDADLIFE